MKTKNIILIVVLAVIGIAVFKLVPGTLKVPGTFKGDGQHQDVYYCPMHPQITSDKPGECPICYMKLVKKEESSAASPAQSSVEGYSTVMVDMNKQQLIGVKTTAVVKKSLVKTIRAYGYVAHDLELYEAQLEYIDAWRVYYSFVARRPTKDEFRGDWRQYYKNEPAQGRWRSDAKFDAQKRLVKAEYELRHMGLTDTQMEQLRHIKYGQPWIQPDLIFFEKDQPFWIYAQIFENDLGFIAVGQKVVAKIPAYGETLEGVVRSVAPFVDLTTRTSRVRIELPSYRGELSVNMFVDVQMPVELDEALLVPREAVMDTGLRKVVFVEMQSGIYEPRDVTTGFEGDDMVVIKSGVKEGEMVVSSGNFLIDSESRLKSALEGFSSSSNNQAVDVKPVDPHAGHGGR